MNCSGKHAAMLATCVAAGWPARELPRSRTTRCRQRIKATIESLAGEPVTAIGVDGCGAPLMALSLRGLARAFAAVVRSPAGSAERRVADAMRAYPDWMSGTRRYEATLMRAVPGMLMKPGADGVCAFALADGRSGAVKIDDGGAAGGAAGDGRAAARADRAGFDGGTPDLGALDELAGAPVFGGGEPVGQIRPVLP